MIPPDLDMETITEELLAKAWDTANDFFEAAVVGANTFEMNTRVMHLNFTACAILGITLSNMELQLGTDEPKQLEEIGEWTKLMLDYRDHMNQRVRDGECTMSKVTDHQVEN